jgi:ribose-phosphate pyrophosphokinase
MLREAVVLGFPDYRSQARGMAAEAGLGYDEIELHHFPDGESRVRLPPGLPQRVVLCRSLDRPNDKLVELFLAARSAREQGVETLALVAPYLCYMRQDKAFHPGEAVSQRIVGGLLAEHFDALLSVDAHLHRVHRLADAVPVRRAVNLTATEPMAAFLSARFDTAALLVGPDRESEQWVRAIAERQGWDYRVASKERLGDHRVRVRLPEGPYSARHLILVDDIAGTGRTLEAIARALVPRRPASLSVLVTHALFMGDAVARLRRAGFEHIWSCDSVAHSSNRVPLAGLLSRGLAALLE